MPSDARVLALLAAAGDRGISTGEFMEAHVGRAGSAIHELRRRGAVIEEEPIDPRQPRGAQRYFLRQAPTLSVAQAAREARPAPEPRSAPYGLLADYTGPEPVWSEYPLRKLKQAA